jgi:hypothetical protein
MINIGNVGTAPTSVFSTEGNIGRKEESKGTNRKQKKKTNRDRNQGTDFHLLPSQRIE